MSLEEAASDSDTIVSINDNEVETNIDIQTTVRDEAIDNGQPIVKLGKLELFLLMIGY